MKHTIVVPLVLMLALTSCLGGPPGCSPEDSGLPTFSLRAQTTDCPPPPPPPSCGACITGDPHLTTFDNKRYDLQVHGEVIAIRDPGGDLEVQVRAEPRGGRVSSLTATAMRVNADRVTITLNGEQADIRVNGRVITPDPSDAILLDGGGQLGFVDNTAVVAWPDGSRVSFSLFGSFGNLYAELAPQRLGQLEGVLGDGDGDTSNDLRTVDGRVLDPQPEHDVLYDDFALGWRVSDDNSLFDYGSDESTATFTDLEFPQTPPSLADLTPEQLEFAEQVCLEAGVTEQSSLNECLLDVGLTGDPAYAQAALQRQQRLLRGSGVAALIPRSDVAWSLLFDGTLPRQTLVVDALDQLLVQTTDDDGSYLVAIDARTGEQRWRLADVVAQCGVAPTSDGRIVVMAEPGTELGGVDNRHGVIVIVDAATGTPIPGARWAAKPDDPDRLGPCSGDLAVVGDIVVMWHRKQLSGFDISDVPRQLWVLNRREKASTSSVTIDPQTQSAFLGTADDEDRLIVQEIDVTNGSVIDEVAIPGDSYSNHTPPELFGPMAVFSTATSRGEVAGQLVGVARGPGGLSVAWTVDALKPAVDGMDRVINTTTVSPQGQIVGWSASRQITSVNIASGEVLWHHRPSSFRNKSTSPAIDSDGNVYTSTFGGDWLEKISPSGELVWSREVTDFFAPPTKLAEAQAIGPIFDGVLYIATSAEVSGQWALVALEVQP